MLAHNISHQGQQVSFVNSICTMHGGSHHRDVQKRIVEFLKPYIEKEADKERDKSKKVMKRNISKEYIASLNIEHK